MTKSNEDGKLRGYLQTLAAIRRPGKSTIATIRELSNAPLSYEQVCLLRGVLDQLEKSKD